MGENDTHRSTQWTVKGYGGWFWLFAIWPMFFILVLTYLCLDWTVLTSISTQKHLNLSNNTNPNTPLQTDLVNYKVNDEF